jgi:F-type H+-transporting ATPase subunit b
LARLANRAGTASLAALACCLPGTANAAAGGLNLFPNWWLVAFNVVVFLLLVFPVNRLLLQPLVDVLHRREQRSAGTLAQAEVVRSDAAGVRERVESRLESARGEAQQRRSEMLRETTERERARLAAAREEATRSLDSVRTGIGEELEAAREALRAEAGALAREMAAKLLGREP